LPVAERGAIVAVNVSDLPNTDGLPSDDVSVVFEEMVSEKVFGLHGLPVTTTLLKTPDTVGVPLMVVVFPGVFAMLRPAGKPVAVQVEADAPVVAMVVL
jgi:hypothetical protein